MTHKSLSSKMKLLLVQPSRLDKDGSVYHSDKRWLIGMNIPYIAALTPPDVEVSIADDCFREVDYDGKYDLVGLTYMSHQASRAYQIAGEFRKRGVPVVLGGFHTTLDPEEAMEHSDAIVCGEAEYVWPELIQDFQNGHLKKKYAAAKMHDLKGLPVPRYDLLNLKRYYQDNLPTQTSRGCPYACTYCEVTTVYGAKWRYRPTDEVVNEIAILKSRLNTKWFYFVDDIFNANKKHAVELCERLIPLNVGWACLCTSNIGDDLELLRLMKRAGCTHINIGLETISKENLKIVHKEHNKVQKYEAQLKALRDANIEFSINIMFGLDGDTLDVFAKTLEFLQKNRVPISFMFILSPRVGLKIREELQSQGRILHDDWDKYFSTDVVFTPKNMTKEQLEEGFWWAQQQFYSIPSILKRLFLPPHPYSLETILANLFFRSSVNKRVHPLAYY